MTVIDASCMLELLLRGPACRAIEERLLAHDGALSAPHLLDVEVSQVLRRYWLGGQLLEERGREAIRLNKERMAKILREALAGLEK